MGETMTVVKLPVGDDRCPGAMAEFEVDGGDLDGEPGTEWLARRTDPGRSGDTLAAALDRSLPALSLVLTKLGEAATEVDEITVDMGLRIGGETGLVFVKGSAEATIKVSLTWRRPAATPATSGGVG